MRLTCEQAALRYRERGWAAIALCDPGHYGVDEEHRFVCESPGKMPCSWRWKHWQKELPSLEEIRLQWQIWPSANVGVVLGRISSLIGVDIDTPNGLELLHEIAKGQLPKTSSFSTGRGLRFLYTLPCGASVKKRELAPGIDLLGEGSLTVMPPSHHVQGATYRWLNRHKAVTAPSWLMEVRTTPRLHVVRPEIEGIFAREGERNRRLFRLGCAARRHGVSEQEIAQLLLLMNKRCSPPLPETEVRGIARSCGKYLPSQE